MTELELIKKEITTLEDRIKKDVLDDVKNEDWVKLNQQALDDLISKVKAIEKGNGYNPTQKKNFGEVFASEIESQFETNRGAFESFKNDRHAKLSLNLKTVGNMTTDTHLTGDPVFTYGTRSGIIPSQKINLRELIPTTLSATGQYATYKEDAGEGGIDVQTEGEDKSQIDFKFTKLETVTGYTSGFVTFSKQLMNNLPWLQTTLVRALNREFFKKENALFYTALSAGTGFDTTDETDDVKQILDILAGRADQDYNNSFIICNNKQVARFLKLIYMNAAPFGVGAVTNTPNGAINIMGTPIIGASFADPDTCLFVDVDYVERVETESLRIDFSFESKDNFNKNLVTARIECQEEINMLRPDSVSLLDMGNES